MTVITVTYTDVGGNTATCNANVTVSDTTSPVAICQDVTVQLDQNGTGSIDSSDVNNGSSDACGIELLSLNLTSVDCSDIGAPVEVVLTVTDSSGNTASDIKVCSPSCHRHYIPKTSDCKWMFQASLPDFTEMHDSDIVSLFVSHLLRPWHGNGTWYSTASDLNSYRYAGNTATV